MLIRRSVLALALLTVAASAQPAPAFYAGYDWDAEAALVEDLLSRMTVEEKLGQLTQYTGQWAVNLGGIRWSWMWMALPSSVG